MTRTHQPDAHTSRPKRIGSVHVETLNNELCLYEWTRKTVHALNPVAACIWQMCDGETPISTMIARLNSETPSDDAEGIVWLVLEQFQTAGLLERALPEQDQVISRRDVMKRLGVAAAAVPFVTTIVAPSVLHAQSGNVRTFNFTGATETFTVPAGVTSITIDAYGAPGGPAGPMSGTFGRGGRVTATLPVTPLEELTVKVGGQGEAGGFNLVTPAGGYNGGGAGSADGLGVMGLGGRGGGGGGGASDVRRGATLLVVAGGGGGGAAGVAGGNAGGLTGNAGASQDAGAGSAGGGGGGTQAAGGAAGSAGTDGNAGAAGASGTGGAGGTFGGAGGGGGYFGGGGGGGGAQTGATRYNGGAAVAGRPLRTRVQRT